MTRRTRRVVLLPGDGVGPEVTRAAVRVLGAAAEAFDLDLVTEEHPVGWAAVQASGSPLPADTLAASRTADAVFLGAVGHPDAAGEPTQRRPEAGLLALRSELGCHTNIRPLRMIDSLTDISPLRDERVRGVDLVIVRELAGGLYYGRPRGREGSDDEREAHDTLRYGAREIARVAEAAFGLAARRRGHVVSVDKANVLESSRLWREVVGETDERHPAVRLEHMLVDRAAMELVVRPGEFDVILTGNLFGDILSDEAAGVAGSLGLLPSASLGGVTPLFEPVHGSAPDLAGLGVANPTGAILSASMLLGQGLGMDEAARGVEHALEETYDAGYRTVDVAHAGEDTVGTERFVDEVVRRISRDPRRSGASEPTAGRHRPTRRNET